VLRGRRIGGRSLSRGRRNDRWVRKREGGGNNGWDVILDLHLTGAVC